jgi:molybdopterin/thiamine biosynthesis adenylyltransferase
MTSPRRGQTAEQPSQQSAQSGGIENIVNRYDRQQLIQGWDQEKLEKAKIAVVGTGILGNYTALCLAALGFGKIGIYGSGFVTRDMLKNYEKNSMKPDYSEGFLYFDSKEDEPKADAIAEFIKKINPLVDSYGVNIDMCRQGNISLLGNPDLIFDATNDPASKIALIEYAAEKRIPVISMSTSETSAKIGVYNPNDNRQDKKKLIENIIFAEFKDKKQGTTTSQFVSAIAADEARKYLMPIKNEKVIKDIVVYNLESDRRFDDTQSKKIEGEDNFKNKKAVMIGAGALGNFAGLDLVLNNVGNLLIIDFDRVEATNLNRQIWFYDAVGELKSKALADKLKRINPRVDINYSSQKLIPAAEDFIKNANIDLLIDTVDNNKARALINYFSLKFKIPFISGGTRYDSGQVTVSIPGETACLNCQADIDRLALQGHTPHQSCIYAPQPSVITSNQVIASLIGGEARAIFQREKYGDPVRFVLKYISGEQYRVASLPSQDVCECHKDKKMLSEWKTKMAQLYN